MITEIRSIHIKV